MAERVPTEDIERVVGVRRHATEHWARAISEEQVVYVLHPVSCLDEHSEGLLACPYTQAQDLGIDPDRWPEDVALHVVIDPETGDLVPA